MSETNGNIFLRERGNGWWELPSGEKVHGRNLADTRLALLHAGGDGPSLTGRLRFLKQAGIQYQGQRDIYTTAGYTQQGAENFDLYWALYERDPVAGRVVDMAPKTTWKTPPEVFEGDVEKDSATKFDMAFDTLATRLKLWKQLEKVDRLSRVGEFAVLLIGTTGGDDLTLSKEIEGLRNIDDVLFLSAFSQKHATIQEWETDPTNRRFGLPTLYNIDLSSGVAAFKGKNKVPVHWSRLIHVAEDALMDETFGRPILKRALNALDDLLKVTASTGEAYWQLAARTMTAKIDPNMSFQPEQIKAMGEDLEALVHDLRRQFIGHGVDVEWKSGEVPNPLEALEVYKSLIAAASGYPTRILFGSERGELASTQDERNYFGTINERQEQHAEPNMLRALIDRLILYKVLPFPKGYTVVWPTLYEHTDEEIAAANKSRAETAKALTPLGGDPLDLVEIDGDRNVWLRPSDEIEARRPAPEPPPEE